MTDVSRRDLLRGVSLVGAAGVGAATGVGTHALFTDSGVFASNSLDSGSLDLQVATRSETNGTVQTIPDQDPFPETFVETSTITVEFPNIDPNGESPSGTVTVAFRACDDPGQLWSRADGNATALADSIDVTASYASNCGGETETLYEGSLSGFLDVVGSGRPLRPTPKLANVELQDGEFVVVTEDGSGDTLAVDAAPGPLNVDFDGETVSIEISAVHRKNGGEVRGVDVASDDVVFSRVDVAGRGTSDDGIETYRFDCASPVTDLFAGPNQDDNPSELSHFVLYTCAGDGCVGCDPACLVLDWELPDPDSVAGESLSVDLELHARQCRHTEASNPWQ